MITLEQVFNHLRSNGFTVYTLTENAIKGHLEITLNFSTNTATISNNYGGFTVSFSYLLNTSFA